MKLYSFFFIWTEDRVRKKQSKFSFFSGGSKSRLLHQVSKPNNENTEICMLGHYLAGLIEGDGSIIVPNRLT